MRHACHQESRMKPRIFLGSSGKQAKLLQAITRGLEDVADVEPWTTTFNPGRSHTRPTRRALPGGRLRRVRLRPGRLDRGGSVPAGRGVAAGQRGVRGGTVRRRARHAAVLHPPRERCEAAERPARADDRPLRPVHQPGGGPCDQPEASQRDRDRGSSRSGRGVVVAALADRADRGRAVGGGPRAHLSGTATAA